MKHHPTIITSLAASNTYQRFIKVPTVLAVLLAITSWITMASYTWLLLWNASSIPFVNLVVILFLAVLCYPLILWYVFNEAHSAMIKRRLWIWGQHKFSSWEEFSDWIGRTHHLVLDHVAGLPDDKWYPDMKRGGIEK